MDFLQEERTQVPNIIIKDKEKVQEEDGWNPEYLQKQIGRDYVVAKKSRLNKVYKYNPDTKTVEEIV